MKKQLSALSIIVLVGNITLSAVVITDLQFFPERQQSERIITTEDRIKENLSERGLEADHISLNLKENSANLDRTITFLSEELSVSEDQIIEVLATRVLKKKTIALESAESLISIAHTLKGCYLPEKTLKAIHEYTWS